MSAFFIGRSDCWLGLLVAGIALVPAPVVAASCLPDRIDERVKVAHVYDGDTLRLEDGRHVRIIGINTPEMGRDPNMPEALAEEARETLLSLLPADQMIGLRYGDERHDRYRRLLAHVFVNKDIDVGERLLQQGLAVHIVVPPNIWHMDCYQRAEQQARHAQTGLWATSVYRPLYTRDRSVLNELDEGFHFITGRVVRIRESNHSVWLILEGDISLRIDRDDLHYFKHRDLIQLKNHEIVARGWLVSIKNRPYMRIRHPAALWFEDR